MVNLPKFREYNGKKWLDKYPNNPYHGFNEAAKQGNMTRVEYYMNENDSLSMGSGAKHAAEGGHKNLVEYFCLKTKEKGQIFDWNCVLEGATEGNHLDLVILACDEYQKLQQDGVSGLNRMQYGNYLMAASYSGHADICKYILENHLNDMNVAGFDISECRKGDFQNFYKNKWLIRSLEAAAEEKHHEICELIYKKIDDYFDIDYQIKHTKIPYYAKFLETKNKSNNK